MHNNRSRYQPLIQAALLSIPLALTGCGGSSESDYVEKAEQTSRAGDTAASIIEYKNALRLNPDNANSRLKLGELYLETYSARDAAKELQRAADLGAPRDRVLPSLALAYLLLGDHEKVLALDETGLDAPSQSSVLTKKAQAHLGKGQIDEARATIAAALAIDPDYTDARVVDAWFDSMENYDQGELALAAITVEHPQNAFAWRILGQIRDRAGELPGADEAYSKALELEPLMGRDWLARGMVRTRLEQLELAQGDIDRAKQLLPDFYLVDYAQGTIHYFNKDYAQAKTSLDSVIGKIPLAATGAAGAQYQTTRLFLAASNYELGNYTQAESLLTAFLETYPDHAKARMLQSKIFLAQVRFIEAEEVILPVTDFEPENVFALSQLADAYSGQGKYRQELEVLDAILAASPDHPKALRRKGAAHFKLNELEKGTSAYRKCLAVQADNWQAAQELVLMYIQHEDIEEAQSVAKDFADNNPTNPASYNILGFVSLADKNIDDAAKKFARADELDAGNKPANLNLAELALQKKDYDAARSYIQKIEEQRPADLEALLKLAKIYHAEGALDNFESTLKSAVTKHPTSLQVPIKLAMYYIETDRLQESINVLEQARQRHADNLQIPYLMAQVRLIQEEPDYAITLLNQVLAARPNHADSHYMASQAYSQKGQLKDSRLHLEETIRLQPDHFAARLTLARLAYRTGDRATAQQQLAELKKLAPNHPEVTFTEALLTSPDSDTPEALERIRKLDAELNSRSTMLALTEQEQRMGFHDAALARLQAWLSDNPEDVLVILKIARLQEAKGEEADARKYYEQALQLSPMNVLTLNNLAWLLRESDSEAALGYIERAETLAPKSKDVADTHAVILFNTGAYVKAMQMSERATRGTNPATGNAGAFYHQALIANALGRDKQASELLTALLARDDSFNERESAKALLTKIESR